MNLSPRRLGTTLAASGLLCAALGIPGAPADAATPAVTYAAGDVVLIASSRLANDADRVDESNAATAIDLDSRTGCGALDASGNLYYATTDDVGAAVVKVTPTGTETVVGIVPLGAFANRCDLSIAPDGDPVLVAEDNDSEELSLSRIDAQTATVQVLDDSFAGSLRSTVAPDGRIYYMAYDEAGLSILSRALTPGAEPTAVANLALADRSTPDIASDGAGNLYTVQRFYDDDTEITTSTAFRFTRSDGFKQVTLGSVQNSSSVNGVAVTRTGQVVWTGAGFDGLMIFRTPANDTARTDDVTAAGTQSERSARSLAALPQVATTSTESPTPGTPAIPSTGSNATKPSVEITGTKRVGRKLRAELSGVPVGAKVAYQWIVDGKKINGPGKKISARRGHRAVFKLSKRQLGAKVVVKATITLPDGSALKVRDKVKNVRG